MKRLIGFALKATALPMVIVFSSITSAFGQSRVSVGDYTGGGPEGTIGRGTDRLPGGPSDWGGGRRPLYDSYYQGAYRPSYPNTTYSRGYSSAVARPYLTNQHYEPGDGYRYPLYYNPATRGYFYYPVRRGPSGAFAGGAGPSRRMRRARPCRGLDPDPSGRPA